MLHGHILEIRKLHPRPNHQVLLVPRQIRVAEALLDARALEVRHGGEEEAHVNGRKEELVACHARDDGAVFGRRVDVADEEFVPFCGGGAEDYW
jgi:hypothetical protein